MASRSSMNSIKVPLIIRGEIIEDYEVEHLDRSGTGSSFVTPNVEKYMRQLVNDRPSSLLDLYSISYGDILDYMEELGQRLDFDKNPGMREAYEGSRQASNLSDPVLESIYRNCVGAFQRDRIEEVVNGVFGGPDCLEGWVPSTQLDGRTMSVRAMGARAVHVIAGNIPSVAVNTVIRSAISRSDTIIKLPSNDPLTSIAIARTMIEMAPDHPLTKHLTVAYWKGGDEKLESQIYNPRHIEKIVAWGGYSSIKHITKYLQPGIDLITLDPKSSTTLIGKEAFADEATMREVARRTAVDMGGVDQEACFNARVIYVESGTDAEGVAKANTLGEYVFEALQNLPTDISNGPKRFDQALKAEIESIQSLPDWYQVFTRRGDIERSGAVIVSQLGEQVDFAGLLYGRVGNIVPMDNIEDALKTFTAATQTVGIYPDSLRESLREKAAVSGGQMITSLGYASRLRASGPQDGIEPLRRMCKWVADNAVDPAVTPGPWMHPEEYA